MGDVWQLDAFNHATGEYERVCTRRDPEVAKRLARSLGLKAWRVWNRTKRVDKPLLPRPRVVNTFNHDRRFSRVHASKKEAVKYQEWGP